MDKYKFGEFIYNQRKKLGLTQDELGRKLNVTNKAVSKWETGETLPDIQLLEKLANTLEVSIDELLTQTKKEVEIEKVNVKPKRFLIIIHSIITFVLLFVCLILMVNLNENPKKEEITLSNAENYFLVTPCEKSNVDGLKLTIYGSIKKREEIVEPLLSITLTIQYYYQTTSDVLSEILYIDRKVTYDGTEEIFCINVEPKNQVENFQSFYGFNVLYEIIEVKGSLV